MEKQITWQATDHNHTQKSMDWFWVLGILSGAVAIVAILFANFFFALLIIIAATTLAMIAKRRPRKVTFILGGTGLTAGAEFHPWSSISAFWIKQDVYDDAPILLIDTTKVLAPHLSIPLPTQRVEEIHALLLDNAPEAELQEPASHRVLEFFGL